MTQIKIFKTYNETDLEKDVNKFLKDSAGSVEIIDIKLSTIGYGNDCYPDPEKFTALIIYKVKLH